MFLKYLLPLTIGLGTVFPTFAAGPSVVSTSVPPASFLNYHVATVHELSQEVTLDPAVRRRLAIHFHINGAQLTNYVRRNLVRVNLHQAGNYQVACVRRDGQEYWVQEHLLVGTPIFASRVTGHPILKLACGNPMVSSLPPGLPPAAPLLASTVLPTPSEAPPAPGLIPADFTPNDLVVAGTDIAPAVVEVSPSFESFINPGTILSPGGPSFNFLGPAIAGGLALVVAGTGHHGSPSRLVAPIPETSTFVSLSLLLALGGITLLVQRRQASENTV